MDQSKQLINQSTICTDVEDFATEAYSNVWCHLQEFLPRGIGDKVRIDRQQRYLRDIERKKIKVTHFTKHIGKAVRVTQFLLRDYFSRVLSFAIQEKSTFKKEAKLMWLNWLANRNNIYVKVIDTLAILAEIFMFCERERTVNFEVYEITEWFVEWFDDRLASEFFISGGWSNLKEFALKCYDELYEKFDKCTTAFKSHTHLKSVKYTDEMIEILRESPVKFPVPEKEICSKGLLTTDLKIHRRIVYLRFEHEYSSMITSSKERGRNIQGNLKVETQHKIGSGSLNHALNEESVKKVCSQSINNLGVKKEQTDSGTKILSECQISDSSDDAEDDMGAITDYLSIRDLSYTHYKHFSRGGSLLSHLRSPLSVAEFREEEQNLPCKESLEVSSQDVQHPNRETTELDSEEQIYLTKHSSMKNSSEEESCDVSPVTLKQTLTTEDLPSTKPKISAKNPGDSNFFAGMNPNESLTFDAFIELLHSDVPGGGDQVCLLSEKFSNSFEDMCEAYCDTTIGGTLGNADTSEESVQTSSENGKTEQKSADAINFNSLKVRCCDYRYFFIGQ